MADLSVLVGEEVLELESTIPGEKGILLTLSVDEYELNNENKYFLCLFELSKLETKTRFEQQVVTYFSTHQ